MHVVGTTGKLLAGLLLVELLGPALEPVAAPMLQRSETQIGVGVGVVAVVSDIAGVIAVVAAYAVSEAAVAIAVGT